MQVGHVTLSNSAVPNYGSTGVRLVLEFQETRMLFSAIDVHTDAVIDSTIIALD